MEFPLLPELRACIEIVLGGQKMYKCININTEVWKDKHENTTNKQETFYCGYVDLVWL